MNPMRVVRLMTEAIERCRVDLSGAIVLTEAATGAYTVTPVLAALAGARAVFALTRSSKYGTVAEVAEQVGVLARLAGVVDTITIVTEKTPALVGQADIITNSHHLRPIDGEMVGWMKSGAVIPLMYEAWEFRAEDIDLPACRRRGIAVAGTRERHPAVDVYPYLGVMAAKLLLDAGIPIHGCHLLLLCDNPFRPFIREGLIKAGATVEDCRHLGEATSQAGRDAVVVALHPRSEFRLDRKAVDVLATRWPGTVIAQVWGDIDREALAARGISFWPPTAPAPGHMGILPSDIGPDALVRLQTGGLKVGEILHRAAERRTAGDEEFLDKLNEPTSSRQGEPKGVSPGCQNDESG